MTNIAIKAASVGLLGLCFFTAHAQEGPPIRIIVPFAAGGGGDLLARNLAPKLSKELGRTFIVENKVGASGQLGMQFVKSAPADGSVVVFASDQATIVVPLISAKPGYDTLKDFVGLGQVARFPYSLVVSNHTGVATLADFVAYLKKNPAQANVGMPSTGGIPELISSALEKKAGVAVTPVPYSGATPIIPFLLGGQLSAAAIGFNNALPLHTEGKAKVLAVSGDKRSVLLPAVPTFEELGMTGLKLVSTWTFYAPKSFAPAQAQRFNTALNKILAEPEMVQKIASMSMEAAPTTLKETASELQASTADWAALLKSQGLAKP